MMVNKVNLGNIGNINNLDKSKKKANVSADDKAKFNELMKNTKAGESTDINPNKGRIEVNKTPVNHFQMIQQFQEMERYKEIVNQAVDENRMAKLEKIKRAIENGTYDVSPEKVAAKILKNGFLG